jgi:predicted phosphodiesterase
LSAVLSQVVKEAFEIQTAEFTETVEQVTKMLGMENGRVGNLCIKGRLVEIEPMGQALVIGDLHGDIESLVEILRQSNILKRMDKSSESILIFLGDYGDRGPCPAETYYTVLKLKLLYPHQVILMRGNHEGPEDLMPSPHDLPSQFQTRFGEKWTEAYAKTRGLFERLYTALLVPERYLMVHGGLPKELNTVEDLAYAHTLHPKRPLLEEILWSDPDEAFEETSASPRGAGRLFGKNISARVLAKLNVRILIRGHEPCEDGFKISHNGRVLTLFSRKGPPYFNAYGAYLDVKLDKEFEDADKLIPYIHKF